MSLATKLLETETTTDAALAGIKAAIDANDLVKAAELSMALHTSLKNMATRAKANSVVDSDPDLAAIRKAALAYFKDWDEEDLLEISAASDSEEMLDAIGVFAQAVADRKGYGAEGMCEVQWEFSSAIAEAAGLPDYFDT